MAENLLLTIKQGIKLLRNGKSAEALEYLQHAARVEPTKPVLPFLFGCVRARAQRKWAAAVKLCETALT